jgi:xanthine dehydrogenase accessory factor
MNVLEFIAKKDRESTPIVVATLIDVRGSAPQDIGAKAVFDQSGLLAGTIGGGKLEEFIKKSSIEIFDSEDIKPIILTKNLQKDIGMTCGGEVTVLLEPIAFKTWDITLFGAGHVAQALAPLLLTLNCRLKVIDSREEWLDKIKDHPHLRKIKAKVLEDEVLKLNPNTYLLSITQGHAYDTKILNKVLGHFGELPFMGVIGSAPKANTIRKELLDKGHDASKIEKILCPIGLPIGSNAPAEIAISIAAQLIQVRDELN